MFKTWSDLNNVDVFNRFSIFLFGSLMLNFGTRISYASNSMSTINSFSPGSSQINFVSVETVKTLDHKRFSFLGFLDSNYQSLAVYNSSQTGNDILSFTHLGLSYGLSPKIEIGLKGPVVFNQTSESSQASLVLTAQGFVNLDGFVKYRLIDNVKSGLTLMAQLGVANGDEIFYVGPGSGLSSSISVLYEKTLGSWLLAANLGFIQRTPGEQESLPFFEPIQSTLIGSLGIGRPLTQKTRLSAELLLASHSFVQDNSDRGSLAAETLFSFHTKLKGLNLSYGLGTGLTDGIATPTLRGFLGFQYAFDLNGMRWAQKRDQDDKTQEENSIQKEEKNRDLSSTQEDVEPDKALDVESQSVANKGNEGVSDITVEEIEQVFIEGGKEAQVPPGPKVNEVVVREFPASKENENVQEIEVSSKDLVQNSEPNPTPAQYEVAQKDLEQIQLQNREELINQILNQAQTEVQDQTQVEVLTTKQVDEKEDNQVQVEDREIENEIENENDEDQKQAQSADQVKEKEKEDNQVQSQAREEDQIQNEELDQPQEQVKLENQDQTLSQNQMENQKQTTVEPTRKGAHKFILNSINFDYNSAKLDSNSLDTLRKVLIEIRKKSYTSIKIWGHTDYYGSSVYNEYLGLRRAKAVFDFLEKEGLSKTNIDYDAFGERRPVSVGISDPDRKRNRRVEIVVYRDLE